MAVLRIASVFVDDDGVFGNRGADEPDVFCGFVAGIVNGGDGDGAEAALPTAFRQQRCIEFAVLWRQIGHGDGGVAFRGCSHNRLDTAVFRHFDDERRIGVQNTLGLVVDDRREAVAINCGGQFDGPRLDIRATRGVDAPMPCSGRKGFRNL